MGHGGEVAADFAVKDQSDAEVRLSDHHKKNGILSFHPLAWTGFCAGQTVSPEENVDTFAQCNTVAAVMSIDPLQSTRARAKSPGIFKARLLSDFRPHGAVTTKYGIFREKKGISEGAHFVRDKEHRLIFFQKISQLWCSGHQRDHKSVMRK